jgi:hypothetical protein
MGSALPVRPMPPASLLDPEEVGGPVFVPSPELNEWARSTFIEDEEGALFNEEHRHLMAANIGFLWAGVSNTKNGMQVLGQCEFRPPNTMGKWPRARAQQQLDQWFPEFQHLDMHFLITIDARYAEDCSDIEFCALIEHELLHCGQERDEFGAPKFSRESGLPIFAMRGHDVQEFVSIVRRYGADAAHVRAMVDAANKTPEIAAIRIAQACGTCQLKVA